VGQTVDFDPGVTLNFFFLFSFAFFSLSLKFKFKFKPCYELVLFFLNVYFIQAFMGFFYLSINLLYIL
jgi:hypothetical protein